MNPVKALQQWEAQQAAWRAAREAMRQPEEPTVSVPAGDVFTALAAYHATQQRLTAAELVGRADSSRSVRWVYVLTVGALTAAAAIGIVYAVTH